MKSFQPYWVVRDGSDMTNFRSEGLRSKQFGGWRCIGREQEDITGRPCLWLGQGADWDTVRVVGWDTGHRRNWIYRMLEILEPGIRALN
jgi:hypothetical protein